MRHTPRRLATSVAGEVVEATGGYPYFLQFFGAYLWRAVPARVVTSPAYRAVEAGLLHELDLAFFDDRFEGASTAEQEVLLAMAEDQGRARIADIRGRLPDLGNPDELTARLLDRGLVYRAARGSYEFALPLFRRYLQRRQELTERVSSVRNEDVS